MFRFGTEIFRNQFVNGPDNTDGSLLFLSFPDFLLGLPAGSASAGGNGTPLSNVYLAQVSAVIPDSDLRSAAAHFFVVDDWRVSDTLTINLGFASRRTGSRAKHKGNWRISIPTFYVPPPRGGFTNPSHVRVRPAGQLRQGRRRKVSRARTQHWSMTRFNCIRSHASASPGGLLHRTTSSSDPAMDCTRTASASLDPALTSRSIHPSSTRGTWSAPPMPHRACNIRFPVLPLPSSFPNFAGCQVRRTREIAPLFSPSRPIRTSRTRRFSTMA